ncbi:transposable element Tcb1 transposase [Trichonephila clavipes]|nr:transposable element Tcb1 transposase [Trichonephila clavipes]
MEWNQVVLSDEFRFDLSIDGNRVLVWRVAVERLNPAFALQQHTTPTAGAIIWGDIDYIIRKQRSAFDHVSEFNRGRIVAYRDCGLSFREIGYHIGRNQTTVMRICDRCMQEGTTDRRGQSHPPQCTTSREDRQIVRIAVTDRSVTSRTIAQYIESVTHHSVYVRTIRQCLQQSGMSARHPLLGPPLTQNHRRLRRQ